MTNKSFFGLNENVAAALTYVFGPITGIIALILERENKFVRFHALQSTLWFLMLHIVGWVLGFVFSFFTSIPVLGGVFWLVLTPVTFIVGAVGIVSRICLIYKAACNETYKIPVVGDVAWSQINK